MALLEKINDHLIKALKGGDSIAATTLRGLKSDIKYYQIEKGLKEPSDDDIITVLTSAAKKRRDSIEQFRAGNRNDLVEKESRELEIIQAYLPKQLSSEEIEEIVKEAIAEAGASSPSDMGKVMKVIMPKVKGLADGKIVKDTVTRLLS